MKAHYSQAEFMFLFLGMTAILPYPPPLLNYQLPIVAVPVSQYDTIFKATPPADLVWSRYPIYLQSGVAFLLFF
jgi:hypothetical protein